MAGDCLLTADAVCSILEACKKSGVSSLTFCGLHVEFRNAAPGGETPASQGFVFRPEGGETPLTDDQGAVLQARIELTPEEKQVLEDARLSQLMTDDPLAYEQEVIDAKLEDLTHGEAQKPGRPK